MATGYIVNFVLESCNPFIISSWFGKCRSFFYASIKSNQENITVRNHDNFTYLVIVRRKLF